VAVTAIQVYPTCDVHLLLNGPGGVATPYQLRVRDAEVRGTDPPTDLTTSPRTTYESFLADDFRDIADVSSAGRITPLAAGETFTRIRHTDTDVSGEVFVSEIVVRIRVHEDMDDLWIGNNQVTLYQGQDNYVLTIYGHFTDGTIGDVSSHPYLTFTSSQPGKVAVDDADDKGRLRGVAETGETGVPVRVAYKATTREVDARVEPPLSRQRPILECIHGEPKLVDKRRNILVLAEGFAVGQKGLFRYLARVMVDRLFESGLNAPFHLLKDQFNVWVAFDPTSEAGITPGNIVARSGLGVADSVIDGGLPLPPDLDLMPMLPDRYSLLTLISHVGLPDRYRPVPTKLEEALVAWQPLAATTDFRAANVDLFLLPSWFAMRGYHLMQAKDSRFGWMSGARWGDRTSTRVDPAVPPARLNWWYLPELPTRALTVDRRRMDRTWRESRAAAEYLKSLRVDPAKHRDSSLGALDGRSAGRTLVVYLLNGACEGGTADLDAGTVALSVRTKFRYAVDVDGPRADHVPGELFPLPSFRDVAGTIVEELVSVLAHELGHIVGRLGSLAEERAPATGPRRRGLHEEYEGRGFAGFHDELREADTAAQRVIDAFLNVTHHYVIGNRAGPPGAISMTSVKWGLWHRVQAASVLMSDARALSGNRLQVSVAPSRLELAKWRGAKADDAVVFLRSRTINNVGSTRWLLEGPLKVQEVQADGTIILSGSAWDVFKADDVLYRPSTDSGGPLTVFEPAVLQQLRATGQPFARKADVTQSNQEPAYPPDGIPGFNPLDMAFVVGVYEGGATYNAKVYRASGACRMRSQRLVTVKQRPVEITAGLGSTGTGSARDVTRYLPYCYVCQYVLTNVVDPTRLDSLAYPR
jgi:hypothetical protein